MKYLFCYIVYFLFLFNNLALASVKDLPEDFEGPITRAEMQKIDDDEEIRPSFEATLNILYEIGGYIYKKYTIEEISDPKFIAVLRQFFPEEDDDQLEEKRHYLELGYYMYAKYKEIYNKIISFKLVPDKLKRIKSETEFDHPNEVEYREAPENKFYVVNNFKKFLTYSEDPKERKSIALYEKEKQKELSVMDKINDALQKIEWKKVLLYGNKYKNPLLSDLGSGDLQITPYLSARLISPHTYIEQHKELDFGIRIITKLDTFVLANNLDPQHLKPQIDLSQSTNVEHMEITYPIPLNADLYPFIHKYFGDFLIPIKVTVKDINEPVTIKGDIKLMTCDNHLDCDNLELPLELTLAPSGEEYFTNGYSNYFFQQLSRLPQKNNNKLKLNKIFIEQFNDRQRIHMQFISPARVKSFKVFVEEKEGYTGFSDPFIRLHDDKIEVNIEPMDEDKNADLINKNFIITASLNNKYHIREIHTAKLVSEFDPDKTAFNWGIVLLAILGGFILNFMPCVFPVLSLKIISLSRADEKHRKQLRRSLWLTIAGILTGFTVLIIALIVTKYLGYSLGWGMQFQNLGFIIAMTFIVSSFTVLMPHLNFNYISRFTDSNLSPRATFLVGTLIVLLSTPCTGPYLATAIGFALSGTYIELIVILYAVALGLALPYLFALCEKEPEKIFPKPGNWMNTLHKATQIMLYLTILWFLSLVWSQTDTILVLKICGILLLFLWIFSIYHKFQIYLSGVLDEQITEQLLRKIRIVSHLILVVLFISLLWWSTSLANKSYTQNYAQNMLNRQTTIDIFEIKEKLSRGESVLLEIGADWCLTCHVNNFLIFNAHNKEFWKDSYKLNIIRVDWTNYNKEILDYMEKFGRKGLPFYILYTPNIREGIVLPEIFDSQDLQDIIKSSKVL